MNSKHRDDLNETVRDAIRLHAAYLTQRMRSAECISDGQAIYSQSYDMAVEITERILKHYRISRSARSERVVKP
jgi:hypothetical protein